MSFGKKGVVEGRAAAPGGGFNSAPGGGFARPASRQPRAPASACSSDLSDEEISARREAFLAAERAAGNIGPAPIPAERGSTESIEKALQHHRQTRSRGSGIARPQKQKFLFGDPRNRHIAVAYVLWYFGCVFSVHRFYCGASESGWYQIATLIGGMVITSIFPALGVPVLGFWLLWIVADLFLMPGLMRRFKAKHRDVDYDEVNEVFA